MIYLKNGHRIVADSVQEVNGRVEYTIGDNTFAIPKSVVEKIDSGAPSSVPEKAESAPPAELPVRPEQIDAGQNEDLMKRVLHDGRIDIAALKAIEDEGITQKSAMANLIAGNFEEQHNRLPEAARYLNVALVFAPDHAVILAHYASVLLQLEKSAEALPYAERAARSSPESADAWALLGYAYYKNNRLRDAIIAWKKSLALRPNNNDKVQGLLERAERESKTEAEFREKESSHFVLRYEGSHGTDSLRDSIVSVLEAQYGALQNDLGAAPRNAISVSLYTEEEFFDVTRAPAWSAAVNDGKLRIPVSGLTGMTPELTRVLRHELTHSFTAQITHNHIPVWLDEGLAQLEEPRTAAPLGARLASLYASGNQVPLNQLEGSFQNFSDAEAAVAYAEALAATECIRSRYGMSDLARILQRLGAGESIESALRNTIHGGYTELESEIGEYLKRTY